MSTTRFTNSAKSPTARLCALLIAGCLSSAAFAQASDPAAAPVTHADQKAAKQQAKADKRRLSRKPRPTGKTEAQADADKAHAEATLKDAKKQ